MVFSRLFYLFLFMLISCSVLAEDLQRLLPVDEAERDLSFVEFRKQLKLTVKNRDPEGFVKFVSEQVYSGPERKRGMRYFVKFWEPETNDSDLWMTMEAILNLGGGFVRSDNGVTFCAPYVFTNFPDNLDVFGHGAIIGDKVPLKTEPLHAARNVSILSYDLLKVEDWRSVAEKTANETTNWIKVSTMAGRKGFVDKNMLRSPADYSACFLFKQKSGWKLVSLVSNE